MIIIKLYNYKWQILPIFSILLKTSFQEDVPEEFASHILNFISRNKIGPNGVVVSN